jgi:hypothetical protein
VRAEPKLVALKAEMAKVMAVVRDEAQALAPAEPPVWGTPRNGLRLGIGRAEPKADGRPRLLAVLDNVGTEDLVLSLGEMFGLGKKQMPQAVRLTFTDSEGKQRTLLRGRGQIDEKLGALISPFVVPLPAGSRYTITCDLADYVDARDGEAKLTPGRYRVRAEFVGRALTKKDTGTGNSLLASMTYWTGTITSDDLAVALPANPAR